MNYFRNVKTPEDLKRCYYKLALLYHPDKGGSLAEMQKINNQYNEISRVIGKSPENLQEVKIGNIVYVNNTKCTVTVVEKDRFKARSLETGRETYFSKTTGYAMFNFKFKAKISSN